MLDTLALIDACEHCYAYPMYRAGPDGRDAATITRIDGQTVVVFRGTVTDGAVAWLDWLNDLRAALVYYPSLPGLVHAGFAHAVWNLLPIMPRFDREPAPLVIGHSKAGAMALIFAMRLYEDFGLRPKVVTFGAPRAGNVDFARSAECALEIDRYENPHDIVPRLPLVAYRAAGSLVSPDPSWPHPRGIVENHSLETGYRPWIETYPQPPAIKTAA